MNDNRRFSSRERVLNLINFGKADQIPKGELCINDPLIQAALDCKNIGFSERLAFVNSLQLDIISLSPSYPEVNKALPKIDEYLWPDLEKWTKETPLFSFAILDGAFEWGLRVFGFQEYFVMLKKSPHVIKEFVDSVVKFNSLMIDKLVANGINGIILADDVAYQRGLLVSPKILREIFFPSLVQQVEKISKLKVPTFFHSDGDYRELLNDLTEAGFLGLHCIDKNSGMLVEDLQSKIGQKLCLWGHLDLSDIERAKESVHQKELISSIHQLGTDKRFILGTNSGLFEAMDIDVLRELYKSI